MTIRTSVLDLHESKRQELEKRMRDMHRDVERTPGLMRNALWLAHRRALLTALQQQNALLAERRQSERGTASHADRDLDRQAATVLMPRSAAKR